MPLVSISMPQREPASVLPCPVSRVGGNDPCARVTLTNGGGDRLVSARAGPTTSPTTSAPAVAATASRLLLMIFIADLPRLDGRVWRPVDVDSERRSPAKPVHCRCRAGITRGQRGRRKGHGRRHPRAPDGGGGRPRGRHPRPETMRAACRVGV